MDRLDTMQTFARVVETRSFTKAAETLQLSRTSVTQQVQQLEARLRVKLLVRTTRKVNVTPEGARYYEQVQRLLAELQETEAGLTGGATRPSGRLRVDVPSPLARLVLVPALPAFHARYPDIQIHLGASDRKIDLVDENVDCVLRGGELREQSLVARHVADLALGVYASPAYLAAAGRPAHPLELEQADGPHHTVGFLWSSQARILRWPMQRGDERVEVQGRYRLAVDEGNAYLAAGLAGMGLLWLPRYMAGAHLQRGELQPVFEDWTLPPMPLYLAYAPRRHVSARLRVFIDWLAGLMTQLAPVAGPPAGPAGRGAGSVYACGMTRANPHRFASQPACGPASGRRAFVLAPLALGLCLVGGTAPARAASLDDTLAELQQEWDRIRYQTPKPEREKRYEALATRAQAAVQAFPQRAEPLLWKANSLSATAGEKGPGFGALALVRQAKSLYESAIALDPAALQGSAYRNLGVLFYKVPGWPIGFGDMQLAREMLQRALALDPEGADANYFYAEYLVENRQPELALPYLDKALAAPARPQRAQAQAERREEALALRSRVQQR